MHSMYIIEDFIIVNLFGVNNFINLVALHAYYSQIKHKSFLKNIINDSYCRFSLSHHQNKNRKSFNE